MSDKQTLRLINSDCVAAMDAMPECSVNYVITDPPYGLSSGSNGKTGFMGQSWDRGDSEQIAFSQKLWLAVKRVLVPGGIVKGFSGSRTYHRQAAAMYKAGFEELPMDSWAYGCLSDDSEIMVMLHPHIESIRTQGGDYTDPTTQELIADHIESEAARLDATNSVGWKLGVDLVAGDCIRIWEPKTMVFGWHILSADQIRLYDYDSDISGNMVVLSVDDFEKGLQTWQILTPNHRVLHMPTAAVGRKPSVTCTEAGNLPMYEKGTACYIDVLRDETYHTNGGTQTEMLTQECWRMPEGMPYKGKVWCVTVPTGAFVARRTVGTGTNGEYLAFVTGNSGFPKSLSISKALTKKMWRDRETSVVEALASLLNIKPEQVVWASPTTQPSDTNKQHTVTVDGSPITVQQTGTGTFIKPDYIKPEMKQVPFSGNALMRHGGDNTRPWMEEALKKGYHEQVDLSKSVCPEADLWAGWGTAAKPAWEPILVGRKPLS